MKRLPITQQPVGPSSSERPDEVWFQTVGEITGDPAVSEARVREFAEDRPFEPPAGVDRRTFMTLMGASIGMATMAGCRRQEDHILPFTRQPEDFVPGRAEYYATAMPLYGTAIPLLVKSVDGRPIKIEGNPDHPDSLGASSAFVQGSVLDLYDPYRSKAPRKGGKEVSLEETWNELAAIGKAAKGKGGAGLAILTEDHRSRTTASALYRLQKELPQAQVYRFEPFGRENQRIGVQVAFGEPRDVSYRLDKAEVVVCLDADILGTESNPIKNSKGFAKGRRPETGKMSRIYVAEPCPTITGHGADHRLRIQARRIADLAKALAGALGGAGVALPEGIAAAGQLSDAEKKWVNAAAQDLAAAKAKGLLVVGTRQPMALHALAASINLALGAVGTTMTTSLLLDDTSEGQAAEGVGAIAQIVENLKGGKIDTLLILGGNPVFNAPSDRGFADALKQVKTSIHVSPYVDETSQACTMHIPRAHYLESWSDAVSESGAHTIVQPIISPMYGGKTDAEILEALMGGARGGYDLVVATWQAEGLLGLGSETAMQRVIHDGVYQPAADQVEPTRAHKVNAELVAKELGALPAMPGDFEVAFAPDPHAYDGRFANNAWLLELPDPMNKGTWMSMAAISATTAKRLNVENGDLLEITVSGKSVSIPAVISFGHADDSVTVPVGLGRRLEGAICNGVGVDTNKLRTAAGWGFAAGSVKKGSGHEKLAITQGHFVMEGRPLIRNQSLGRYGEDPKWASQVVKHPPLLNLYKDWEYKGHKWGLAVDLTLCTGCSACVTACQAENNIPVVGIAGVIKSREMHWIRIDRYFAGKDGIVDGLDEAQAAFMPMACQHCENAPCEQVCPVAATTHSPEGINEMTYNRCIGTKYCGNNCPFKVRRFNFFHYNAEIPEERKLVLNPDVTVRFRGVMEKCTFCVQRVNQAKIAAKKEKDPVAAKTIIQGLQTACMQACPTDALTFGDLNDSEPRPDARPSVAELSKLGRAYAMLEEINVRPRISYLGRITNPHPDLAPKEASGSEHGTPASKETH